VTFTWLSLAIFFGMTGAIFMGVYWITPTVEAMRALKARDDSDPPEGKSHMIVLTDHLTGRQYLAVNTVFGLTGITPRLEPIERSDADTPDQRADRVWAASLRVWKTPAEAEAFLTRAHPLLEGRAPIMVARSSPVGIIRVEQILGQLEHGTAV
jgi:hypothetical protein